MGASGSTEAHHSALDCCVRRGDRSTCCDLNNSFLGEDAFYRDAFYDCEEGNCTHDWLFEQAQLKMRKGRVLTRYASFELSRRASSATRGVKTALSQCVAHEHAQLQDEPRQGDLSRQPVREPGAWLGNTIEQWTERQLPETNAGPFWSKGDGKGLNVRCGPNYRKTGRKMESSAAMYEAMTCDALKADNKIENIIGRHILLEQLAQMSAQNGTNAGDYSGGPAMKWSPSCKLPRIICVNMMLPYSSGVMSFRKDPGCSFVGVFEIKPETIKAALSDNPPPHIKLLMDFCNGPSGKPGGDNADPDRCLASRITPGLKKDQNAGLFKAVAKCVNPEDVNVPDLFNTYNGKPCLITKCGYVVKDPKGEWIELGIDVRGFNVLARKMLGSFRHLLPRTKIHYGFMIQGVEDEELPEGLLCDMYVHGINMMESPTHIQD